MFRKWTLGRGFNVGMCWSPNDPPEPPPAPTPPLPAGNTPPARGNYVEFPTKEAFQERLEREARAQIKDTYGMSEKELKDRLAKAKEYEDAEAARQKEQMTKEQRLEAEKAEAEAKQKAAEADRDAARRQAEVTGVCARLGFKNLDYATFEATRSGKSGAELEAHFVEMAKDEGKKAALGLVTLPPEQVPVPGSTGPGAPPNGAPPPPPAPPGGAPPPAVDVMKLSPADFQAHLSRLG